MQNDTPVLIAGAGPVGLVAAADLVRRGIPVTVFESQPALSRESRASTFHPPTLDMLDDLGFAKSLMAEGLKAPTVQYCTSEDGVLGTFDFAAISDLTRHPYRVQAEQFKLTAIIHAALKDNPLFQMEFNAPVLSVAQDASGVEVEIGAGGKTYKRRGSWLIGTDGARSAVRRSLNIDFEGFTWPERFLVMTTPFDFATSRPGVSSVSYVADPERWHFLLRIIGAWRVMMPVPAELSDEAACSPEHVHESLAKVLPEGAPVQADHVTLYRVHQRVAKSFRLGRAFLAGDAAHINNPLGGMGMNGGIHDALNLTKRLADVIKQEVPESDLDNYDLQRRTVTMEAIQHGTIKNKRDLEARDEADRARFRKEIRDAAADPEKTRQLLRRVSMLDTLRRAAELRSDSPQ